MNLDLVGLQRADLGLKCLRKCAVVQRLVGGRIAVQQWDHDQRGLLVGGDVAAADIGATDIGAQLVHRLGRTVPAVRHHRAAAITVLGDFGPAQTAGPQTPHPVAVDARKKIENIVDLLQLQQIVLVEDVAIDRFDRHANRVAGAGQRLLVLQEILNVRVRLRDHLLEARIDLEPRRMPSEKHRHHQTDRNHHEAMIEDQPFEPTTAVGIEILGVANDRNCLLPADIHHLLAK